MPLERPVGPEAIWRCSTRSTFFAPCSASLNAVHAPVMPPPMITISAGFISELASGMQCGFGPSLKSLARWGCDVRRGLAKDGKPLAYARGWKSSERWGYRFGTTQPGPGYGRPPGVDVLPLEY